MAARIASELALDDATRGKVESILDSAAARSKSMASDARAVGRDLKAEHDKAEPDLRRMEKLIRKMADLRANIAIVRLHAEADVDKLLTPEQRVKLRTLREEHHGRGERDAQEHDHDHDDDDDHDVDGDQTE